MRVHVKINVSTCIGDRWNEMWKENLFCLLVLLIVNIGANYF
jgi:hypothetical protein